MEAWLEIVYCFLYVEGTFIGRRLLKELVEYVFIAGNK